MKTLASVLCALAASIAGSQVTYQTTGATVAKIVAEVSNLTDQKLTVNKQLAREIVVVSVKDISLNDFRKRLADCVTGKWTEKEGGILELGIDDNLSNERRKLSQEGYAKSIPDQIKSSLKNYSEEGVRAIRQDTPSTNELALEIGKRVSESNYAKVAPGGRLVFSTNPNRMQLPLPDVSDLITKHLDPEVASLVTEIVFAVERPYAETFTRFCLYGLDGSGRPGRALTFTFISLVNSGKSMPPATAGVPIKWSPVSQEIAKIYRNWDYRATKGLLSMPQSVRDALSKPTEIDPMAYGFGEGILACAAGKGEDVMACIPDDNVGDFFAMGISGTTTGEFWQRVIASDSLVAKRENGWITIRPTDPESARDFRGDRMALEHLINKAKDRVWPSLDDIAEFFASNINRKGLPMAFIVPYQALVNNYGTAGQQDDSNFRPLQLFACLSQSEKQKLRNGDRLAFASLSTKAKGVLNAMAFEPSGAVLSYNLAGEATELFSNGLPASFVLAAQIKQTIVFAPLLDAGDATMAPAPVSPRDIAVSRWTKQNEPVSPYAQEIPELNRVLIGSRQVWDFSFFRGAEKVGGASVAADSVPKDAKPTTMDLLSQPIQDQLEQAHKDYLKEMGGGG
ncbi:MAG: hypothetical protein M3R13_03550 [Armatimonadota bacterium]|nr:hypothetical protein [Armatimonadota bacterium]